VIFFANIPDLNKRYRQSGGIKPSCPSHSMPPRRTPEPMSLSKILFSTEGRIPRSAYWYYYLAYAGIYIVAALIDIALGTMDGDIGFGLFSGIWLFFGLFPSLAVSIKRCHDRDRSGWFLLLNLIPLVSWWVRIELAFLRGTVGDNQYGPEP
jgi:uncharacterized membrane protein YhaH (DUF805 family)